MKKQLCEWDARNEGDFKKEGNKKTILVYIPHALYAIVIIIHLLLKNNSQFNPLEIVKIVKFPSHLA